MDTIHLQHARSDKDICAYQHGGNCCAPSQWVDRAYDPDRTGTCAAAAPRAGVKSLFLAPSRLTVPVLVLPLLPWCTHGRSGSTRTGEAQKRSGSSAQHLSHKPETTAAAPELSATHTPFSLLGSVYTPEQSKIPLAHPLVITPPGIWPSLFALVMITTDVPITPHSYHTPSCGVPAHGAYHRGCARYLTPLYKHAPPVMDYILKVQTLSPGCAFIHVIRYVHAYSITVRQTAYAENSTAVHYNSVVMVVLLGKGTYIYWWRRCVCCCPYSCAWRCVDV